MMYPDFCITRFIFVLFLWLFIEQPVHAQFAAENFTRYTVKDGLSDNNVTCLEQDDWGFIWVGTEIGLNRFDGYRFKNYYQGSSEKFVLSSYLHKLITLDRNRLIIVSSNGFQVLHTTDFAIQHFFIPDSTAFVALRNKVWDVKELANGTFATTTSSGFYVFQQDGTLAFRHDAYGLNDIGNKRIFYGRNMLTVSANKILLYVEESSLAQYDIAQKVFRDVSVADREWSAFMHPSDTDGGPWVTKSQISDHEFIFLPQNDSLIYYNHKTNLRVASALPFHWFDAFTWESKVTLLSDSTFLINGGFAGFYSFHIDREQGRITSHPDKFLGDYKINSLFLDRDERLWAGTTQGLLQQKLNIPFIKKFHWPVSDFSNEGYVDGLQYKDKLYLARHSRDAGLVIMDTATMQMKQQIHFFGRDNQWNEIYSLQMYHPDTLWLGSFAGLLWLDTKTNRYGKVEDLLMLPSQMRGTVNLAPVHQDGYAWMLLYLGGVVARYNLSSRSFEIFSAETRPALPFNKVKQIAYDAYGDIWVSGHSLARWNNRESFFDTLITVYGGVNKFNDDILVTAADAHGSLWLHNGENGLLEYQIKKKNFVSYSMKDGLPSDVLRCFSPIVNDILWIGSHNHLTRFDTRSKKMEVYGYQDGLPPYKPISRKIILDNDKTECTMFFGDEVIQFPVHPLPHTDFSSALIVEEVIVNNNQSFTFPSSVLRLKPGENNLSVFYTVVDFEGGHNYQFAYKLLSDDPWTSLGQQRNINLSNLSPGSYSLQLSATGKSGEPKLKTFAFSIALPYWKRSWFMISVVLGLLGVSYSVYRSRIASISQKANIDKLLSQTEMKALHAQMNPHFIFNSLNSIKEMVLEGNNGEASKYLSKFAHLIRITLEQSRQSFISLRDTIEYLERYIEMEKIRNPYFQCQIFVDPDLQPDETILPPMLIQPFIENSIWHGTNPKHKRISIEVEFHRQGDQLVCSIDDTGIGIEASLQAKTKEGSTKNSTGIDNAKNRIQLLNKKHNTRSSIKIEDKSRNNELKETGTRVTLVLPLDMAEV